MASRPRAWLEARLRAGLSAVEGGAVVRRALGPEAARGVLPGATLAEDAKVVVLAIGKAAVAMAGAACDVLDGRVRGGLIVTGERYAERAPGPLRLLFGGHPVPDERSARAGAAALAVARDTRPGDHLLVLLSGGATALSSCPPPGLSIADLAATTEALLACGADIEETNCVRKHLSAIAGGGLVRASAATRVHLLAISDVRGDRLDVIGSGPCSGDPTTFGDALAVVRRHGIAPRLGQRVMAHLEAGARGERPETLAPDDDSLARVSAAIVARNADARAAIVRDAAHAGARAADLGERLHGEARVAGRRLGALGRALHGESARLIVVGGETVVTLHGDGRGGRSQELALAAAIELSDASPGPSPCLLAAGSDGRDGPTDAAGGFVDPGSVARAAAAGRDAEACLARNDSHAFLEACDGLVRTGPTDTNVMDLALVFTGPSPSAPSG